jgi:hypothetical protein
VAREPGATLGRSRPSARDTIHERQDNDWGDERVNVERGRGVVISVRSQHHCRYEIHGDVVKNKSGLSGDDELREGR